MGIDLHRPNRFASDPPLRRVGLALLAALVLALHGGALFAVGTDDARGGAQGSVAWMGGGVGEDARDAMRLAASGYNVHVVFSERRGAYLADVPFTVTRGGGAELVSGISPGPLLYLKLPPGAYRISARLDDAWQSKRIRVVASTRPARLSFVSGNP